MEKLLATLLALIDDEDDQRKFEAVYQTYKHLMFHVSNDYFHTQTEREDAVQEAFVRIIKNFSKIGEIECAQTKNFIILVVRSTCIDLLRKDKEEVDVYFEDISADTPTPSRLKPYVKIESQESYERLLHAINSLPQNYRDVFMLRYLNELSLTQITEITGLNLPNIKKILQRGRKKLSNTLKE
ncbi:sigma-70 family RNA polymerase sigma factor [Clostridium sp. D33t1_170424_F3]|uniref:RNA polymerase sigma factor n=1 Tax=Clostridium sp. D33t1_170424_F3 TaxID=2787099 RepID=UPI0018A97145